MTVVLVGILALSIDLSRAYNLSTELDNAADAYALAGATQLDPPGMPSHGRCSRFPAGSPTLYASSLMKRSGLQANDLAARG